MLKRNAPIGLALGVLIMLSSPAAAESPSPEQRSQIEAALRAEGFTRWGEIEREDGGWEVDDAIAGDGRKYELKLNSEFRIIRRERD